MDMGIPRPYPRPCRVGSGSMFHYKSLGLGLGYPEDLDPFTPRLNYTIGRVPLIPAIRIFFPKAEKGMASQYDLSLYTYEIASHGYNPFYPLFFNLTLHKTSIRGANS
ncbi:hypothetical protein M9H77_23745 [Catharanthus roseus]|uniref:Uncharacterized protein n=1 Tax=Catharanthus roseus TaxID=4058 RepID=A0ACC0ATT2_CATRO|nr:hypothetical protein M9H77_23745 [Catharanthus roseus]